MKTLQSFLAVLCVALVAIPPAALAQNAGSNNTGTNRDSLSSKIGSDQETYWHSRFTNRYRAPEIAPINLANSPRIEQLLRAGQLYLSVQDAVALALENNLDIELQRYGPRIAEADLLRARAGGVVRGVPIGISQGPGSAGGVANSGVAAGALSSAGGGGNQGGGAATGGATVLFTGTQIPSLDEQLFVNYNWGHSTSPQANSFLTGIPAFVNDVSRFNTSIQRGFLFGTLVQLGYSQTSQLSNSRNNEINPFNQANFNLQITQPLLRGFGVALNSRNIRIAQNQQKISNLVFKQQVIATVATVVNLYSDLVSFNEDVKVRRQALSLAEKLYNDNRKQVEIGTLAPIEIVRAEAEVARSQQELTQAETQVLQQETILKNYISRTGVSSPSLADARIVPTDPLRIPDIDPVRPIQDLVATAISNRPEFEQTRLSIDNARTSLQGSKSALLPDLSLVAGAQNNGLAGDLNALPPITREGQPLIPRQANPVFLGGFGSVFSQLLGRNYPDYSIGFQLNVPLRNRSAQADVVRDQLALRQSEIRQRQELNQIRVDVQNAVIGLQQSRAQYQAAQKSRVLQEQTLDAEQKKYALGASTIFFVIQAQRDLAQAQATEVGALSTYNRARVALNRATGDILDVYNVDVEDAMKGDISVPPSPLPVLNDR